MNARERPAAPVAAGARERELCERRIRLEARDAGEVRLFRAMLGLDTADAAELVSREGGLGVAGGAR